MKNNNKAKTVRGNPAKLIPFKKGDPRINRKGAPRKLVTTLLAEMEKQGVEPLKPSHIADAYGVLLQMTIAEITDKAKDDKQPAFVRIIAKAMLSNKGTEMIEKMLDRAHGKAMQKQAIDVTTDNKPIQSLAHLTYEQLLALANSKPHSTGSTEGAGT